MRAPVPDTKPLVLGTGARKILEMAERPESEKLTHADVGYQRVSTHTSQTCDNCRHVIEAMSGTRCEAVQPPIYLTGYCKRWEKK